MVRIPEVQFSENGGTLDGLKSGRNEQQKVLVPDSDFIETTVIYAGTKRFVFLAQKKEACSHGWRRGADDSSGQGVLYVGLHRYSFRAR